MLPCLCVCVCALECPPLGMESHKVEPDQLSASSMSQYNFAPQRARLNMQVHISGQHLQSWKKKFLVIVKVLHNSHYCFFFVNFKNLGNGIYFVVYCLQDKKKKSELFLTALNQMIHFSSISLLLFCCYFTSLLI